MVTEQGHPDDGRLPVLDEAPYEDEVARTTSNLRAAEADEADVEPVPARTADR